MCGEENSHAVRAPTKQNNFGRARWIQEFRRNIDMVDKEWEGDFDPMADPEEQRHILSVLDSFR